MALKIKEEHKGTKVAFGKSARPLGERDDIYILARLGRDRNAQLLQYFENADDITDKDIEDAEAAYFENLQQIKQTRELERQQVVEASKKKKK